MDTRVETVPEMAFLIGRRLLEAAISPGTRERAIGAEQLVTAPNMMVADLLEKCLREHYFHADSPKLPPGQRLSLIRDGLKVGMEALWDEDPEGA